MAMEEKLRKYAKLAVKKGINIQKNQTLVINSPVQCADFARMIADVAYDEGAKEVVTLWNDEVMTKIKFLKAPEEVFETFPDWQKQCREYYASIGAGFLSISARDPELLKDVDPSRISKLMKASNTALSGFRSKLMKNEIPWSILSIPTKSWARKVFNNASEDEAVEKLWDAIFKAVRVDKDDPVAEWDKHCSNLRKQMNFLNKNNFRFLHYTNSLGTDLTIEFAKDNVWAGGADITKDGVEFIANMPTEEVFTAPLKTGVNGTIVSSKPLNCDGKLINNFSLTFKDGRIVDFKAEEGYETLKELIETDEGSHYLGEVALVPYDSPISNSGILFYNTLFDENASCHLAIGKAYASCIKGGEKMSEEELKEHGLNDSLVHVDFMVGTKDLNIVGTTWDGKEIPVFVDGNYAI